jgi:hypothetical protein
MLTKQKSSINSIKDINNYVNCKNDDDNPLFDRKVEVITAGLPARYTRTLKNEITQGNALIICDSYP